MTTTSRRIAQASKSSKSSHTAGKDKGGMCVRPKDHGLFTNGNPYKGAGLSGHKRGRYLDISKRYAAANT